MRRTAASAPPRRYARHVEAAASLAAPPADVFEVLDDHARLGEHMSKASWRTLGSAMTLRMDDDHGRRVGARISMRGRILGVPIALDEVVAQREPPHAKAWETTGTPRLLVIGHYRLSAEVQAAPGGSRVRVTIDYDLPRRGAWLGRLLGRTYARWCVRRMIATLVRAFDDPRRPVAHASGAAPRS